jgi:hypothetical protein
MNIEAALVIGFITLCLGIILLVPGLWWARRHMVREMNHKDQERETQKVPAWVLLIAVVMVFGLIALIWFKEAGSGTANWILTVLIALILAVAHFGLREAADNERAAIFFLDQFYRVAGPGRYFVLPFLYRVVKVNLDQHIPEWHELDEREILRRVAELAVGDHNREK